MKPDWRDRLILPVFLPVGIIVAMLVLMIGFSRILLNTSPAAATAVALVVAIAILATAGVIASRGRLAGGGLGAMLGIVAGVAMVAGGIALAVAQPGGGGEEVEAALVAIVAPPGAATGGFATDELSFPPETPVDLEFDNQEAGLDHNVWISEGTKAGGPTVLEGSTITGPSTTTYSVEPLPGGDYYFFCSIHPDTMTGSLSVVAPPSISAANLQFDTDVLEFPAGTAGTLTFNNEDTPGTEHNVAIYEDESFATALFQGDLITAPASRDYAIPALEAGEYPFQCDVHPTLMSGRVVVGGKGGGDGGGPQGAETTPSPTPEPTGG